MEKKKKKFGLRIILIILAFAVLASGYLNIKYMRENQNLQEQIQKIDISQWMELKRMSEMIEKNCIQKNYENPKEFQLYINTICHNFKVADVQLSRCTNLLTNIYDQLYLDICIQDKADGNAEKYKKAFQELNSEIDSISAVAVEFEKSKNKSIYEDLIATITGCIDRYQKIFSE